jgi:hypothetical protein
MELLEKILSFIKNQNTTAEKDNVLITAIHYMIEDIGWTAKKVKFGADEHELEYINPKSPLKDLEIEAKRIGKTLYLKFEGEIFDNLLNKADEVEYHISLNLDEFVTNDLRLINEDRLKRIIREYVKMLEEKVGDG